MKLTIKAFILLLILTLSNFVISYSKTITYNLSERSHSSKNKNFKNKKKFESRIRTTRKIKSKEKLLKSFSSRIKRRNKTRTKLFFKVLFLLIFIALGVRVVSELVRHLLTYRQQRENLKAIAEAKEKHVLGQIK